MTIIIGSILKHALQREYDDYAPALASGLVRLAVRLVPRPLREEYREEWLSHLYEANRDGHGAGLVRALGLVLAAVYLGAHLRWFRRSDIYFRPRVAYLSLLWGFVGTSASGLAISASADPHLVVVILNMAAGFVVALSAMWSFSSPKAILHHPLPVFATHVGKMFRRRAQLSDDRLMVLKESKAQLNSINCHVLDLESLGEARAALSDAHTALDVNNQLLSIYRQKLRRVNGAIRAYSMALWLRQRPGEQGDGSL